jgi:hypothetical protein
MIEQKKKSKKDPLVQAKIEVSKVGQKGRVEYGWVGMDWVG